MLRKEQRSCADCLPSRLETCQNQVAPNSPELPSKNSVEPGSCTETPLELVRSPDPPVFDHDRSSCSLVQSNLENLDQDPIAELPTFTLMEPSTLHGDEIDAAMISSCIDKAYHQIVHCRHNLFKVPSGNVGRLFVTTLTSLLSAYADGTAMGSIALMAAMTMPALLLQ